MLSIRGELSLEDHTALMRELHEPRRTRIRLAVGALGATMVVASLLAGPIAPLRGFGFDVALPLGAALVLNALVTSPLRFRRYVHKQFAELQARRQLAVEMSVDEDGLTSRDARENPVFLPWAQLYGWRPRPWGIVIFVSRMSGFAILQRWVSPQQRAELEALLGRLRRV